MKRILTIQDISCLGKCSVTIALPVLSAMGVETAILPTALLSTHTMFEGAVVTDLSEQMLPIARHWKEEGIRFDAVYTGYLGKEEEIAVVLRLAEDFRQEDTLFIVDPVMGDHGRLYRGISEAYVEQCRRLCSIADIILPNLTEGAFLTETPFLQEYGEEDVRRLLVSLSRLGAKKTILTGISLSRGQTGAMGYDRETEGFFLCEGPEVPYTCHGTGDLFSSVTAGALLRGRTLQQALNLAVRYTACTVEETSRSGQPSRFGLAFEKTLPALISAMEDAD